MGIQKMFFFVMGFQYFWALEAIIYISLHWQSFRFFFIVTAYDNLQTF